jgi:hypothetical protein
MFGLGSSFFVVVDEVNLGKAQLNRACDFQLSAGQHQIYIRGRRAAFSNVLDVDLLSGSVLILGCRGNFNMNRGRMDAVALGGEMPKMIRLFERSH